jgi:hypothetical protein
MTSSLLVMMLYSLPCEIYDGIRMYLMYYINIKYKILDNNLYLIERKK